MQAAFNTVGFIPTRDQKTAILSAAAAAGSCGMCEWLLQRGFLLSDSAFDAAAKAGHRHVCELLMGRGQLCDVRHAGAAARCGHPGLASWLLERRLARAHRCIPAHTRPRAEGLRHLEAHGVRLLLKDAAAGCDLATLQSFCKTAYGSPADGRQPQQQQQPQQQPRELSRMLSGLLIAAAEGSSPDWQAKVEWLESLATPEVRDFVAVCGAAARAPDALARLTWLRRRGYALDAHGRTLAEAAGRGDVAALEFLLAEGAPTSHVVATSSAASAGQLRALVLLHAHGCPVDRDHVALEAARGGHLPVLEWAAEALGADVRAAELMEAAAAVGSMETMAWLHERGCPLGASAFAAAAGSGCEAALEWAAERGCLMGTGGEAFLRAVANSDTAMLRCLQRLGCPWGPDGAVFTRCVDLEWPLPVLRWLAEAGCPVD